MTINISIPDVGSNLHPQITVLGVGGSGGNAVNNMINSNLEGVDFAIANTDAQALQISNCKNKIQLGIQSTRGLGAGMRPDVGKQAAEESMMEITEMLEGSHMLFIAAGMGGGTGTGAAPVIAKLAREKGILTVGVVTKPFHFEGSQRMKLADKGLEELQQYVDTLLTIPNQNLFRIANEKTTFADAFKMADDVLYAGVRGVTDLMVQPGLINLDFSDVKTVMSEMGKAMMGTGEASGEGRAVKAAEAAIANPLIDDVSLKGAKGLIINITGGNDITLYEVDEAANRIKQEVDEDANIIYGTTCDERLDGLVRVSLVATGIDVNSIVSPKPLENISSLSIDNSVYLDINSNKLDVSNKEIYDNNNQENLTLENLEEDQIKDEIENDVNNSTTFESSNIDEETSKTEFKDSSENINNTNEIENLNLDLENQDNKDLSFNHNPENEELSEGSEEVKVNESSDSLDKNQSSVRRLSLFDTFDNDTKKPDHPSNLEKTEPVFSKTSTEDVDERNVEEKNSEEEFSGESISEDDFNQETDEELLDIPTFLRRQAN
ncbi:cell division protein FtsZ [Alphaproteobacteria bacterium]|nr:cell division protein FtsZ [Alphaproteobacteria bacterium]